MTHPGPITPTTMPTGLGGHGCARCGHHDQAPRATWLDKLLAKWGITRDPECPSQNAAFEACGCTEPFHTR
jgi:hypothetical protein